jgi:flagellar protein FliO/FliZ
VLELVVRIVFSLLVVLGLMWMLARLARRPLSRRGGTLTVLARQQLSRTASVAVVQVADRAFVLGITDGQVTLLGETDPTALTRPDETELRRTTVDLDATTGSGAGARDAPVPVPTGGRLEGSILSPRVWRQTVHFLRERTVRR